jgi:UDP-GlcNAc:undecaprenyl-phosphate/decaprenyl-phosphate GlcNAc-1-phosphate transferase
MHDGGVRLAALGIGSFLGVVALTPLARRVALRYGITDRPGNGKLHTRATPYLGGVAILLTALVASWFLPSWTAQGVGILFGAAVVGLVGLVDDMRMLGPLPRVMTEVAAASLAFATGARVHLVNDPVDWALTVAWLVVLTNAFNLLDNMDGAAGVIASVTAIAVTVTAALGGQVLVAGLAAIVAGCCVGFLIYNWHPARIFLGDAGSLFLGFLLASLALELRSTAGHRAVLAAVVLLAGTALFDTTLVVVSRVRAGRSIMVGGTDHTSHRLARLGLPTPAVVVVLALVTAASCAFGVAVSRGALAPWTVVPLAMVGVVGLGWLLREDPSVAAVYTAPKDGDVLVLPSDSGVAVAVAVALADADAEDEPSPRRERADRRLVAEELG